MSKIVVSKEGRSVAGAPHADFATQSSFTPFAGLALLLVFALTLFLSAALLFVVELMVGKMLLPMLGGTPAVWNTCMVFYQALLLAGYLYAHLATTRLETRYQALLHLGVLLLPFLTLGLTIHRGLFDYGGSNPIPGLLLGLVLSVGLPFFAISTTAPLLQKWFAGTGHPAAKDPYFLYAASNFGSMLGLFGYPSVLEPWLTLANQRFFWQLGYSLLAVLTAGCALYLWRTSSANKMTTRQSGEATSGNEPSTLSLSAYRPVTVSVARRLRWIALAFVPSSLMLGATTYITTDIAAIPLLWVLPLGLYLLSFILVFARLPKLVHRLMVVLLPLLVLVLVFLVQAEPTIRIWWKVLVHLSVLFTAAMVCHGELARDRPSTQHLTEFYLLMSVGGVLGGLFNALAAPLIFNGLAEYPLVLVFACLLTPTLEGEKETRVGTILGVGLMGLFLGAGGALLLAGIGRGDLEIKGLASVDGFWLAAALVAAVGLVWRFARGEAGEERAARWLDLALPAALGVLAIGLSLGLRIRDIHSGVTGLYARLHESLADRMPERLAALLDLQTSTLLMLIIYVVPAALCYLFVKRPLRFGLGVGALLLANTFCELLDEDVLLRERSFFGVLHVTDGGPYRKLSHGTTLHGQQRVRFNRHDLAAGVAGPLAASDPLSAAILLAAGQDTWRNPGREPLTYFHRTGPIGQVFEAYRTAHADRHVGVIGLGSGTMASYGQAGQPFTYYEIDPLVERIAFDRKYFTYVQDALARGVKINVVMGDARLKLEERACDPQRDRFALFVIDAFSSDAIPIHLLTREALSIYLDNLADDGLMAFHISNRYLDLEPVLGNLAADLGLVGFIQSDSEGGIPGKTSSNWVVLSRQEKHLDRLVHAGRWEDWREDRGWDSCENAALMISAIPDLGGRAHVHGVSLVVLMEHLRAPWRKLKTRPEVGVWTDDYSNLLQVFDWKN